MQAALSRLPRVSGADVAAREIVATLRGETAVVQEPRGFVEVAIAEGLAPLLWKSPALPILPQDCIAALEQDVHRQLALAAMREPELRRILDGFGAEGIDVLVVKGAHLAYTVYQDATLRPRQDTDLLIRPAHLPAAQRALAALGYRHQPAITGAAVQGQVIYDHEHIPGAVLDVHSRLASPIVAAALFDFDDLWRRGQPIPALGAQARGPQPADALAIAAVHLLAHHPNERGLLWLYDLHLLTRTLNASQVEAAVEDARSRRMTTLLRAAVARAQAIFPTSSAACLLRSLGLDQNEPSAALIDVRRPSEQVLMDVRALPTWRARAEYVTGHLFPAPDYMRRRYAPDSIAPLPWLYARRLIFGAGRWLRRSQP
jgi:hypothetical protein